MPIYSVQFTNGEISQSKRVSAQDLKLACVKGMQLAKGMKLQRPMGRLGWLDWRVVIDAPGEGRFDQPFPSEG
jgi:hypothetical protein